MAKPAYRISITRKDGKDITFVDYKGDTVSKKYCPVGALFPSKVEGGFSIVLERKVTLDPSVVWVNVYPSSENGVKNDEGTEERKPGGGGGRRRNVQAKDLHDDELPD